MATISILVSLIGFVAAQNFINANVTLKTTAVISQGVVAGIATTVPGITSPVSKFLGIPFAGPPQRFSPPIAPGLFTSNPYNATQLKASCIQQFSCK